MCWNNGWGGNGCLWIILILILICCCGCGTGGNSCGCGCNNNNCGCGNNNNNCGCDCGLWPLPTKTLWAALTPCGQKKPLPAQNFCRRHKRKKRP